MSQLLWVRKPKRYAIFKFFFLEKKAMRMRKIFLIAFLGHIFFLPLCGQHFLVFFDNSKNKIKKYQKS